MESFNVVVDDCVNQNSDVLEEIDNVFESTDISSNISSDIENVGSNS